MMVMRGYHIHVYCQPEQHELAQAVRAEMMQDLAGVIDGAGPVRTRAIGPHPLPMFEAWFETESLNQVLPWILQHRRGLSVMIHPLTGDDYADHAEHSMWIGEKLPLNLDFLCQLTR